VQERLQKLIARAGIASRRHAEQLILSGAVTVNGEIVTELGSKADPSADHIKVSGKLLRFPERKLYLILHKPAGCVSTMSDPEGRTTLREYLHGIPGRVFPVGRLDYHTEGLLLLTNDGDFAHRVMKISRRLWQMFWLKTKGALKPAEVQDVERFLRARLTHLAGRGSAVNPWYQVTLTEARSDLLRPFLARMGHPVEKFRRVKLGNLDLGSLAAGEHRELHPNELRELKRAVDSALGDRVPSAERFTAEARRAPRERREAQRPRKRQNR
jgi:23S rRNA pseudouridine2605 synthase